MADRNEWYSLTNEQEKRIEAYVARKNARSLVLGEYAQSYLNLSGMYALENGSIKTGSLLNRVVQDASDDEEFEREVASHFDTAALVDLLLDKLAERDAEIERLKNG